jgi:hypothetical protein
MMGIRKFRGAFAAIVDHNLNLLDCSVELWRARQIPIEL